MPQTNYTITDEADFNADILAVNVASHGPTPLTFTFTFDPVAGTTITLDQTLQAVNLGPGSTLDIVGNGNALNAANQYSGLYVYSGNVTISDLTIENAVAQGMNGTGAGGGGAGLGGALFIGASVEDAPGAVTLSDVTFLNDSAIGGNGGFSAGASEISAATPAEPFEPQAGSTVGGNGSSGSVGTDGAHGQAGGGGGNGGAGTNGIGAGGAGGAGAPETTDVPFYINGMIAGYSQTGLGGSAGSAGAGGAGGTGLNNRGQPGIGDARQGISQNASDTADLDGGNGTFGAAGSPGDAAGFGGGGGGGGGGAGGGGGGGGGGAGGGGGGSGGFDEYPAGGAGGVYGGLGGSGGQGGAGGSGGAGGFGAGAGATGGRGENGGTGGTGQAGESGTEGLDTFSNPYSTPGGNGGAGGMGAQGGPGGSGGSAQGGGGLGAGGDIFVQTGGQLTLEGGNALTGTATGGTGANNGDGLGGAIFWQDTGTLTLTPGVGQTSAIKSSIADQTGSDPTNHYNDPGVLTVQANGPGVTALDATNTFSGNLLLSEGTIILGAPGAAGSGEVEFTNTTTTHSTLAFSVADAPTTTTVIAGFSGTLDQIDVSDLTPTTSNTVVFADANGIATLQEGTKAVQLNLGPSAAGEALTLTPDGGGGTRVLPGANVVAGTTFVVGTEAELNQAIADVDAATAPGAYTIQLNGNVTEGTDTGDAITFEGQALSAPADLYAFNLQSGVSVTLDGAGFALDGAGQYRGLFAYAGTLAVDNLTIQNADAIGGAGAGAVEGGGGGGAGLGGAVFVAGTTPTSSGANVSLTDVTFTNDGAQGGAGGPTGFAAGGGGGLGGDGNGSDGGGVGAGASGNAAPGIILGVPAVPRGAGSFGGSGAAESGGGVGGSEEGAGGYGGGAGSGFTVSASDGGFGGGGAGLAGSSGGFGGGGGTDSSGGFGGGAGGSGGGGGGLAAGGDIFVGQGGTLSFDVSAPNTADTEVMGGALAGGAGSGTGSSAGAADGSFLFLQGGQTVTLEADAFFTDIYGTIADPSGSGGTGSGGLMIVRSPTDPTTQLTYTLDETNTFTGGIEIGTGIRLGLAAIGAAGSGAVTFGPSGSETVGFDYANAPAGGFDDFSNGDTLTINNAPYNSNGVYTPLYNPASHTLLLQNGSTVLQLKVFGDYTTEDFHVTPNGSQSVGTPLTEGINITVGIGGASAPAITGTSAEHAPVDHQIQLFAGVTIDDSNVAATDTLTITPSGGPGTLTGEGLTDNNGVYTLTDSAETITRDLRQLQFTPTGSSGSVTTFALSDLSSNDATPATDDNTTVEAACYASGTRILTVRGEIAVEDLALGDVVVTASGAHRPIRWIGRRSYAARFLAANPNVQPIRFRVGSLGQGLPRRDLLVSPKHAMVLDGLLIPARCLVNGGTIAQERGFDRVDYFHVELETHDVLLAEGALSESFLDDDSRGMFHNAAEFSALYPDALSPTGYCAPRVMSGFPLEAVRQRLAAFALAGALAA